MTAEKKIRITIMAAAKGLQATFSKSRRALRAFRGDLGKTKEAALSLNGTLTAALGGIGLGLLTRSLFDAGVKAQALTVSFKSVAGTAAAAADELEFIRKTSNRLGQEFYSTAAAYKEIFAAAKGTETQGATVRKIFVGITEAATALHMRGDQVASSLYAIGQMISKGTVQSQELRLQLGNQLPGAFNLAARAMGKTTRQLDKMMSTGRLMTTDFLPKFAKALHDQYGAAASEAADTAQAAMNRFKTSWMDIKVAISNSGFLKEATSNLEGLAAALRDPAVQKSIKSWATSFFALIKSIGKFVLQHGKLMAMIGGSFIVIGKLIGAWTRLNAAMLILTGMRMIPWLASINAGLSGLVGTSLTVGAAFFTAASGLAALAAGYKLGEWLTMRSSMQGIADETARLGRYSAETAKKFREISTATGITITSMEELDAAVKANKIHYDKLTGTWKAGAAGMAAATTASTAKQVAVTGKALAAMKRRYQQYAAEVKRLQNEIAGREMSLAAQLRSMARTGMSDLGAWRDRKKEADEYYRAAQRAAAAGDMKKAVTLADKAKTAYADLNKEVKSGKQVQVSAATALRTAMAGVKKAGELAVDALKKQKDAADAAGKALDKKSGGQLAATMGKAKKAALDLDSVIKKSGGDWGKVWSAMEGQAKKAIGASEQRIVALTRDRHVTLYINEVVRKALGGAVHRLVSGGRLAGYGGGDRIPALLEAGEFVMRKEAVARFGSGIFHALNSLRLPDFPTFSTGGPVTTPRSGSNENDNAQSITLNIAFPSGAVVGPFHGTRSLIRALDRERENMAIGAS